MKISNLTKIASAVVVATILLTGCSGKEEREAKYLQAAQEYFDADNLDKAKIEIKNVLQINPKNANARYLMASMDEKEQNWRSMFTNLSAAIEEDPKLIAARYKLGLLYVASGDLDGAKKQAEEIQKAKPEQADYYALLAVIAQRQNNYAEAEKMANKALAIDPANVAAVGVFAEVVSNDRAGAALEVVANALKKNNKEGTLRVLRIRLLEGQGKTEEVIAAFNEMIVAEPENIQVRFQLAQYYISKKRLADAEAVLNKAITDMPDKPEPKLYMVKLYEGGYKDPAKARVILEKYAEDMPENSEIRNALAMNYLAAKENAKAKAVYLKTIDADPKGSAAIDARNKLILIANLEKDRKTVDALLKEILAIEPENSEALVFRSRLYREENNLEGAIADLRIARKAQPDSAQIVLELADAQEAAGIKELALENYKAGYALQPDNPFAIIGIGRILYSQSDFEKAQEYLLAANKAKPANPEVIGLLGDIYLRQGKWDEAMALLNPLMLKNETAPLGFYFKARLLAAKKDYAGAQTALEQSLAKKPSPDALRDLVTLLASQKKTDQALVLLNNFVKENPKATYAQELIGGVYLASGKGDKAQAVFSKLLAENPNQVGLYRKQLQAYLMQGKSQQDILALLDVGIAKAPKNNELLAMKAEYLQSINKPLDALAIYEELLKQNPKSQVLQNNIAALILDYVPTKENLEKAQRLTADLVSSETPAFLDTVGWLQYKLGNYPQALSLLQDARKKGSQGAVYDYHLGMAYYQNANKEKAKELLEASLASEKENFVGKDEAAKIVKELSAK